LKIFFKDPGNLRYSLNTIFPLVVFLTSLLSIVVALNIVAGGRSHMMWVWIFGVCIFSSFCAFIVVRAMTQPISDLVKKAEHFVRLEEFRKERGQMMEVYNIIEQLMEYARTREDDAERKVLIENMEKLDYIIPLGYMSLMVAHEVRNPLNTITGMSELLRERVADDTQRRYIDETLEAARKIDVFTHELLDFTDNELEQDRCDVYDIIRESVRAVETDFKGVHIDYPKKGSLVCVADRTKLYQTVYNVLKNAAGYERDGGVIKVGLRHDGEREMELITIYNKNSFITPNDYESIFKPFFTRQKGGRGLGLFIGMRNIKLHGGNIRVESGEKGTTFTIELPLGPREKPHAGGAQKK